MEEGTRKSGDLWSGIALAALGAYIVIQARQWEYLGPEGPGAGFFPLWYGVAMLALSVLLIVSNLRRGSARGAPEDLGRSFETGERDSGPCESDWWDSRGAARARCSSS